jgi:hypothetical protein
MGGTFLKQKPFGAIFNTLKTNTMIKNHSSIYDANEQADRLGNRDVSEYEPSELLELLYILYCEYHNSFNGQFNDWKNKILQDRAEALNDKLDSFIQDLDPDES